MKISLAIASLLTLLCLAYYIRWSVPQETRFTRAMQDLKQYQEVGIPTERVIDPWGHDYVKVTAIVGGRSIEYMMSYGPDGKSATYGHDVDDITAWTRTDIWMESLFPFRVCINLMLVFASVAVTLAVLLVLKRKHRPNGPRQVGCA